MIHRLMTVGVVLAMGTGLAGPSAWAGDPCGAVLCLSHNETAPQECAAYVNDYFSIRVYDGRKHRFNPGATSVRRYSEVLDQCQGAEQPDKDRINARYGTLEYSPFSFETVDVAR